MVVKSGRESIIGNVEAFLARLRKDYVLCGARCGGTSDTSRMILQAQYHMSRPQSSTYDSSFSALM